MITSNQKLIPVHPDYQKPGPDYFRDRENLPLPYYSREENVWMVPDYDTLGWNDPVQDQFGFTWEVDQYRINELLPYPNVDWRSMAEEAKCTLDIDRARYWFRLGGEGRDMMRDTDNDHALLMIHSLEIEFGEKRAREILGQSEQEPTDREWAIWEGAYFGLQHDWGVL